MIFVVLFYNNLWFIFLCAKSQSIKCLLFAFICSRMWGSNVSTDESLLFCKICKTKVVAEKKFIVIQLVYREKHLHGLKSKKKRKRSDLDIIE